MRKFFVGCLPQFEEELAEELKEIWSFLLDLDGRPHAESLNIIEVVRGGIEIEAPLHLGLQINFFSKLAHRVLLRISEFRVRDFPKLFQELKRLKKDPFLQGLSFQYEVSAQSSRLNNEKRILAILEEVFGPSVEKSDQSLYLRMSEDICTLSLDSSGENLHKRTERTIQGEASLRETLAAFCVRKMVEGFHPLQLKQVTLIDPMAGTGTLLLEAVRLYQQTERQDFPFLKWSRTPALLKAQSFRQQLRSAPALFGRVRAADINDKVLAVAQKSLAREPVPSEVIKQDLFQAPAFLSVETPISHRWVICNPPYGERLRADFEISELLQQIQRVYAPERLGIVLSSFQLQKLRNRSQNSWILSEGLSLQNQWAFENGGLPVHFLLFSRSDLFS
ncbi:MAG: hypothetical protein COT73_07445 [Bdellovibrio sp. CG10_big_fil_rev_8_21_14_0_10_47_8]|nr:MAG: hypothetical protein COT73_07445 [Bdellovibrio sp. CG10_big_fil_rev_8_21_14_0_10_47_8]